MRLSSGTNAYPHMPILRPHAAQSHERRLSSVTYTSTHPYGNVYIPVGVTRALAGSSYFGLLGEQSSQKWEIPCLSTLINRRAKFDAASFILGGEIRNCTNKQTKTNKQTVNDISTPCLSACVDNNNKTIVNSHFAPVAIKLA